MATRQLKFSKQTSSATKSVGTKLIQFGSEV